MNKSDGACDCRGGAAIFSAEIHAHAIIAFDFKDAFEF